jgi:orotate phosphoribosyltransferase
MINTDRSCHNPETAGYDLYNAGQETWQALLDAGAPVEGDFTLASGANATLKFEADKLYDHPKQLRVVLGHFATFPCVKESDALLYVPSGMKDFTHQLGDILGTPVVDADKTDVRYHFKFRTERDQEVALNAQRPVILEDIVSTLGSVAGMRALLWSDQDVHSLAMLLRGQVNEEFRKGLVDHYLLAREIPKDKEEFKRRLAANDWT